jgi:hypothetical protein
VAVKSSGTMNRRPVAAGIQYSETPALSSQRPTSLTIPLAMMNEQLRPQSSSSLERRPSR